MGRRDVLEVMARLRKHCTIFYSTHILEDVQRVSDMVAILNGGRLVAQAPIQQLLRLVLSDPHSIVMEFGRKKYALEEVFVRMVGGGAGER